MHSMYERAMNYIFLKEKAGLNVMQSHPQQKICFGQYQAHQLCWDNCWMYDTAPILNSINLTCAVAFSTYASVPHVAHAMKATHSVDAHGVVITAVTVSHTLIHIWRRE